MADLLLHIGGHKTGTSFLQGIFHRNRTRLAAEGIHYPGFGHETAHHALGALWLDQPLITEFSFDKETPESLWDRFLGEYAGREGTVLLSSETLSRAHPQRVDMADLARRLAPFEKVRIVYTMRHQSDLVQSMWTQIAKSRGAPMPRPFVRRVIEEHQGAGIWVDHNRVYNHMLEGFAPEQIVLLDYAQCRAAPGGLTGTFLRLMGSDLDPATLDPLPSDLANISPPPLPMYIASLICEGQIPAADLVDKVEAALRTTSGAPNSLLTKREDRLIRRTFRPFNSALVQRVQSTQPGLSFLESAPVPGTRYRNHVTEETWARIAAALYRAETPPDRAGRMRHLWDRVRHRWGRG